MHMVKRFKVFGKNLLTSIYRLSIDNSNIIDVMRKKGMNIGCNCRIYTRSFGSEPYLISIGDNVTVSNDVQFITHDGGVHVLRNLGVPKCDLVGKIEIGNNVFIGARSIILPNVKVGQNCIIAAGSIVTKSIPSNSVVAGAPARVIKSIQDYKVKVEDDLIYTYGLDEKSKKRFILDKLEDNREI